MNKTEISRRSFLKLLGVSTGAATIAPILNACSPATPAATTAPTLVATAEPVAAAFDWKKYAGKQVRFIGAGGGNEGFVESVYKEFIDKTGIDFVFENYQQEQGRQKYRTELQAGQGTVETWFTSMINEGPQFAANGWYEPLDSYVSNPDLVAPDFDFNDFLPSVLKGLTLDGKLYALPLNVDFHVVYYRKDLFEEKGIAVPKTLDELEEAAAKLHNPPDLFGIAHRGGKGHCVPMFASAFHNFGADYLDADGNPALDSPEALEAYDWWGRVLRNYGPPGGVEMQMNTETELFASGRVAIIHDSATFFNNAVDPAVSTVHDKVGFASFPAGPKRNTPTIFVNGLPIASTSKNKEAAFYFLQWITSKEIAVRSYLKGLGQTRASTILDEQTKGKLPEDFVEAANFSLGNGDAFWVPRVLRIPETRDVIGNIVVVAIEGGDVKAAAQAANEELKVLVQEAQ